MEKTLAFLAGIVTAVALAQGIAIANERRKVRYIQDLAARLVATMDAAFMDEQEDNEETELRPYCQLCMRFNCGCKCGNCTDHTVNIPYFKE